MNQLPQTLNVAATSGLVLSATKELYEDDITAVYMAHLDLRPSDQHVEKVLSICPDFKAAAYFRKLFIRQMLQQYLDGQR